MANQNECQITKRHDCGSIWFCLTLCLNTKCCYQWVWMPY